ncbi:ABC transporter permease [Amaricoccus solimangrovi]|uniref:ABC transporter permease n=1 Tax=Amaricoccus solimangrovi TaxID=2589815 RepID=A0A501W978_9RHOB|nr:ABC transporter permease [Amaricoccus solimangrovi]TPE46503.1 ABC transporter permease [Amaricoccus solimangrovi]
MQTTKTAPESTAPDLPAAPAVSLATRLRRALRGAPLPAVAFLALVLGVALLADLIVPHDPLTGDLRAYSLPPAWKAGGSVSYFLGTDLLGRDILSRIIMGARISLIVAAASIALGGVLGTVLGLLAGHFGGWIDEVIMRLVDTQLSLPSLLVALVALVVFGSSFTVLVILIGVWLWPNYARIVRGETLRIRRYDYISLARIAGCSTWRILFVHELPGIYNTLIVMATLQAGWVILLEGSLSYLGVGVPPPTPSWGSMIAEGRGDLASAWWISMFPGLAMLATVLSLNLLGDWLRRTLDPKQVNQ